NTNEFLAGSEYVAKYNVQPLLNTVPYVGFCDCESDIQNDISSASRGTVRPGWDMVYNHYVNRRGLSAIYTAQMAAQVRPEGGGPYTTIASGVVTNLYYTDVGLLPGTNYFYVVSAVVGGVEGSNSLPVSAVADSRLTGIILGSSGSYNNLGATIANVYDNALG